MESTGLPLGPIKVLGHTEGLDFGFNSVQKVHAYNLVVYCTIVTEAVKHYTADKNIWDTS